METGYSLPHAKTEAGFQDWFNELAHLKSSKAASILHRYLEQLEPNPPATHLYAAILDWLCPQVLAYSDKLEHWLQEEADSSHTLQRKATALSHQLLRSLITHYAQLLFKDDYPSEQQSALLFKVFNLIGISLRKQAILSFCPSTTLWQISADLYALAKEHAVLQQVCSSAASDSELNTIALVLQRNLLFALCNPYHFEREGVDKLFRFSTQRAALLNLTPNNQSSQFTWFPSLHEPPRPQIAGQQYIRLAQVPLDCSALLEPLDRNAEDFSAAQQQFLTLRLSSYASILESAQPGGSKYKPLVTDFAQLLSNLQHALRLQHISRVSAVPQARQHNNASLNLAPLSLQTATTQSATSPNNPDTANILVYNTRFADFLVARTSLATQQIEQLALLLDIRDQAKLGIIRQIAQHPTHHSQQVLIEILHGEIEIIKLTLQQQTLEAILLITPDGTWELLLPPGKYKPSSELEIHTLQRQGHCILQRLLAWTPRFVHYRLTRCLPVP